MNKEQLTFEECEALYFDKKALREPKRQMYRLTGHIGGRYYYSFDENEEISYYISVTNMIEKTTPTSPYLIKWIAELGYKEAKRYAKERADYGTLMHTVFTELLLMKTIDLDDELQAKVEATIQENKHPLKLVDEWLRELRKDLLGFATFVREHEVEPLAVEVVLGSDKNSTAGAVDLYCEMTIEEKGLDYSDPYKTGPRKGEPREKKMPKRVKAIVDYKSGRNGFYEDHEIQLGEYKALIIENFPDEAVEDIKLFNYAPTDWKSSPTFKLKDQTDSVNLQKLPFLHGLAKIELAKRKNTALKIEGVIDLTKAESIESSYQHIELDTIIKQSRHERKN